MDEILEVDKLNKIVRVQAGITLEELLVGINEHGLTLPNFASATAREYQINDIVQVGAHGTGASLPPIDEQIIELVVKVSQAEAEFWRKSEGPGIHGRVDAAHRESKYTTTCSYRTFGVRAA
ncbi:L-galactono-1,4-lactone dehydrogenase protein [Thalictrum thalictroides]|uniref:L-galactono-1,4-lactone dehydrogenase protein n=1 Tax=Thalictrum thalictroides TaxID=46969 RepID=A0A7J6VGN9_THATH|nr:L-galactono-1,4-lactone dehydrogenase protein [Thalictrum thalictroides]